MTGVASLIASLGALLTSIAVLISVLRVRKEVHTGNAQTIGMLADATETRRIGAIPLEDRSVLESEHIAALSRPVGKHFKKE